MCCFSKPVRSVTGTRIFAAGAPGGRQFLAYSMTFSADEDLAMILPLPVAQGSGEDAVTFIDLSGYAEFFTDLLACFFPAAVMGWGYALCSGSERPAGRDRSRQLRGIVRADDT